ncbi:hypothetical protein [Pelagibius sp. Alg239-R121]|uniref:hypothetical protein n=1 Tax=Pelagibius sp. Alg239-R121 TaxID=2993448 RepID=UPI0024A6AD95|nr:hypothetical protein [Pelagibius sp. Alg239-R121]
MTMITETFGPAVQEERNDQPDTQDVNLPIAHAPKELLEKKDDRLLRDVGLARDSASGEIARFWSEWSRRRGPGML